MIIAPLVKHGHARFDTHIEAAACHAAPVVRNVVEVGVEGVLEAGSIGYCQALFAATCTTGVRDRDGVAFPFCVTASMGRWCADRGELKIVVDTKRWRRRRG